MGIKRPVNLDLTTMKLPISAYVSILHRLSGILLFFSVGLLIYALQLSLSSENSFDKLKLIMSSWSFKLIVWFLLSGLVYHFVAGIKHLLMDIGIGEELKSSRVASFMTLGISLILIVLVGVWIW